MRATISFIFVSIICFFSILTSCDNKRSYKYVEVVEEEGILAGSQTKEKEAKIIKASTDSAAYLEAYKDFCISLKINKDMKASFGKIYSTPVRFKLLNEKDEEITNSIFFADKAKSEKEIEERIFSMKNVIEESVERSKIDTTLHGTSVDGMKLKSVKESTAAKFEGLTIKTKSVTISQRWTFDSYNDEYRYLDAERGSKFLVARLSISSESKDPKLPAIAVYKVSDNQIYLLGTLSYKFARWEDYGTYLGNYSDYGNDFAHTKTIAFSAGLELADSVAKNNPLIVVVHHKGSFERNEGRFDNPPVHYDQADFDVPTNIHLEEIGKNFTIVKVFNKNKL